MMLCDEMLMLCSGMQCIDNGAPGTRNREDEPKAVHYCEYHPKPASCESLAGAKDATLGSMQTTGSNPKHVMLGR